MSSNVFNMIMYGIKMLNLHIQLIILENFYRVWTVTTFLFFFSFNFLYFIIICMFVQMFVTTLVVYTNSLLNKTHFYKTKLTSGTSYPLIESRHSFVKTITVEIHYNRDNDGSIKRAHKTNRYFTPCLIN